MPEKVLTRIYKWETFKRVEDFPLAVQIVHDDRANTTTMHTHDFTELLLVGSGTGSYLTPDGEYQLEPGDIFLLHPGQSHQFVNQHHLSIYNVIWQDRELKLDPDLTAMPGYHLFFHLEPNARDSTRFRRHLHLDGDRLPQVRSLIERMDREMAGRNDGWQLAVRSLLGMLFVTICRLSMGNAPGMDNELQKMARTLKYVGENFAKHLTRAKLSRMVGMSEATFYRHFKTATGKTLNEYLRELRLAESERLLRSTELSLPEIAERCGFYDSNYFGMLFRKRCKITPHRFRTLFRDRKNRSDE